MVSKSSKLSDIVGRYQDEILVEWLQHQAESSQLSRNLIDQKDLRDQSKRFLSLFNRSIAQDGQTSDITGPQWSEVRDLLSEISQGRARLGFSPAETASFVFSLKKPIFSRIRSELASNAEGLADDTWKATSLLDNLGLYTTELYQKAREEVINRQQRDLLELSTPVVELWEGILALPLIGTLDSARTQVIMENLLQKIVESGSSIAIIDITGVPTVDSMVAQHLLKTVAAARLMGADCIISGIRPQIAQTMVHLGLDLAEVATKASLSAAFSLALDRTGAYVTKHASKK